MQITITLRGSLIKYFDGEKERKVEVPEGCSAAEALNHVGIDWKNIKNFGFVAVNNKKVMIDDLLMADDVLKAYPKISGG